jgi:poly(3-hydroxybutyrate) depolymerase
MLGIVSGIGLASIAVTRTSAAALGVYNVDANSVSVYGLSSGGFMAVQLGMAYSDTFKTGFGVFAGGAYDCARNQPLSHCTRPEQRALSDILTHHSTSTACTMRAHPSPPRLLIT